jgi:hypothetical protein
MTPIWMRAEKFYQTEENDTMTNTDLIASARAMAIDHLQKWAIQQALRQGVRVSPAGSAQMTVKLDPGLIARTRVVVANDTATVELYDPARESWAEIGRSDSPALVPTPEPEPEPAESSRFGPVVPGQLCVTPDGRFTIAK